MLATVVMLEIADNFRIDEEKLRTIFDSNVMANMKFLTSSFAEEKRMMVTIFTLSRIKLII